MPLPNRSLRCQPMHVVYRLKDSIPVAVLNELSENYETKLIKLRYAHSIDPASEATHLDFQVDKAKLQEAYFKELDEYLDQVRSGPKFLRDPAAAKIIIESWRYLEWLGELVVFAISVMPNHVHLLIQHPEPEGTSDLRKLVHRHRTWTARQINVLQKQPNRSVWEQDIFDRDARDFDTVFYYILNNPVKAKLCAQIDFWPGNYWKAGYR